jgi:hypothetical protein
LIDARSGDPAAGAFQLVHGSRPANLTGGNAMGGIIYLVGLVVIVLFILSFLGLR